MSPDSSGRFRGISVPHVPWREDTAAHNERMLEKARKMAAENPDAKIVLPVYKSRESRERAELPEARQ